MLQRICEDGSSSSGQEISIFVVPKNSILCSYTPITELYPESGEYFSYPGTIFLSDPFQNYPSNYT